MFAGTFTALITPFTRTGVIDEEALRKLIEFQIENGVQGLVPVGTTGESPSLSPEEHLRVIQITVEQARKRVPIIAGTGSNSTQEAIEMTKKAKALGVDASLQVTPYYNKPSQEGLRRHFTAVADEAQLPVVLYNIPGRTGKSIDISTIVELSAHPHIVGIKEASGSIDLPIEIISRTKDFCVLSGDDALAIPCMQMGGKGVISVAANIIPAQYSKMITATRDSRTQESLSLYYQLRPFCTAMFIDTNPVPVKYAASLLGMCQEYYRLPLCSTSDENKQQIQKVMKDLKLL